MKPIKKTTFIKIEYWDCGNENHRHKREEVAKRCMERNASRKPLPPQEVNYARYIHAARDVVSGATFKSAGEAIGVSPGRTQQIVHRVLYMSMHSLRDPGEPPCNYYDVREVRNHKDYWLERIDKVAAHWGV
jgi:hypothetical protein